MPRALLILLLVLQLAPAQQENLVDMLPLRIGNSWTYDYYSDSFVNGVGLIVQIDSGTVTYKVKNWTTFWTDMDFTVWTISAIRHLTHRSIGPFNSQDTSWTYTDSTTLMITEQLADRHRLTAVDPVQTDGVFAFDSECSDTTFVYRYWKDEGPDTLRIRSMPPNVHDSSSYAFLKGIGIVERIRVANAIDVGLTIHHTLRSSSITHVESQPVSRVPEDIRLERVYPNPFNPSTNVTLSVPTTTLVSLSAVDLRGRRVAQLYRGTAGPGELTIPWTPSSLPSGTYFIVLEADNQLRIQKVLLLK